MYERFVSQGSQLVGELIIGSIVFGLCLLFWSAFWGVMMMIPMGSFNADPVICFYVGSTFAVISAALTYWGFRQL